MYESELSANDLLRKQLEELRQDVNRMRSEVDVAKAANETSARRADTALAVSQHRVQAPGTAVLLIRPEDKRPRPQIIRPRPRLLVIRPMTEPMDDSTQADKSS